MHNARRCDSNSHWIVKVCFRRAFFVLLYRLSFTPPDSNGSYRRPWLELPRRPRPLRKSTSKHVLPGEDEALVCVFLQIRDLNQGTFGFVQLAWDKRCTPPQQVAVKFMERGDKINKYVESEILNHRMLLHPHIIQFREVLSKEWERVTPVAGLLDEEVLVHCHGVRSWRRYVRIRRSQEWLKRRWSSLVLSTIDRCYWLLPSNGHLSFVWVWLKVWVESGESWHQIGEYFAGWES